MGGRNSSSPTKSSGLRLAATASPRTHLEPLSQRVRKKKLRLVVRRSRKMEGSGHPYGLTTIHACLPASLLACPWLIACLCLPMPHARASKELPRGWKKCWWCCSARCSLHPCTGQGLYMGVSHDWPCYCDVQAGLVAHPGVGQWGAWCG